MELAGYVASLFIGVSLGLIGGGGSILTVPVLVYLFAVSPTLAISYSLFIVGTTSLVGAYNNYRNGLVNFKTVLLFGSSSITTVFIARKFIIPFVPEVFFHYRHLSNYPCLICNGCFRYPHGSSVRFYDQE